jgi:phosphoribosyl 1,2-cyclic phosphodiesterase
LFHHDPGHDDDMMDEIAALCAQARAASVVARDGMVIDIG